jgi:hypothetical protein
MVTITLRHSTSPRFMGLILELGRDCGMDMRAFLTKLTQEAEVNAVGDDFGTGTIIEFKRESA